MKILVVGSGGREHAIIRKLKENPQVEKIYVLPGNAGMAPDAECVRIKATDIEGIVNFAKENAVDYAVVSPDEPLVMGCVDALEEVGVPCFGPRKNAAIIEGSKIFSKGLMKKYGIPTANSEIFTDPKEALKYLNYARIPIVIKADGLAAGKGVVVATTRSQAKRTVKEWMCQKKFGESSSKILIEEFLMGIEVSVLAFTDGTTIVPMISSMDHKRAREGDLGENTGGMGTIAPSPFYTKTIADQCMEKIFLPTIRAMKHEGREFRGCLYFGLMLTPRHGPKVIEFNCRFGDPEAQVVLSLMKTDLLTAMLATTNGTLAQTDIQFSKDESACCVVMVSEGYPRSYMTGRILTLPETGEKEALYIAGACIDPHGNLATAGGRIVGVTAVADTLSEAVKKSYALVEKTYFSNAYYRRDIGQRALRARKIMRELLR